MRVLVWSILGFVAGAVAGYAALMIGYSIYVELFRVHDQDGGGAMAMGLIIGPIVGLLCGVAAAVFAGMKAARRP